MLLENHIAIAKTARYYTVGSLSAHTKAIWIVVHGFAQRAEDFIKEFSFLDEKENWVIAPEALNRFYKRGTGGDTAATWMTKDDRQNEINDYVAYLNSVYDFCCGNLAADVKINVIGFSQGATTASRWMIDNNRRVDNLVFYAGEIAREIAEANKLGDFQAAKKYYCYGTADKIIPLDLVKELEKIATPFGIEFCPYEGGHEINREVILSIS